MARAAGSKTQAVREAVTKNPEFGPKEIAQLLSGQFPGITPQQVSTIKSNMKKAGDNGPVRRRAGKRAETPTAPSPAVVQAIASDETRGVGRTLEMIRAAKALVKLAGSVPDAVAVLRALTDE